MYAFLASHAGVSRGARFSSLVGRDEIPAPLKTPAWEANAFLESPVLLHLPVTHLIRFTFKTAVSVLRKKFFYTCFFMSKVIK